MRTENPGSSVTLVTQTRVAAGKDHEFSAWQSGVGLALASFSGFLSQKVIAPSAPLQVDWVILQRFSSMENALRWMHSKQRAELLEHAQGWLLGNDDIHIVSDGADGVLPSPVSAVISTHVKPGQDQAYRQWERRIAAAQAKAPGFQGCRSEPPVPGVQESWLAIVRFDCDANLNRWLQSAQRQALLKEIEPLSLGMRTRMVRTGFDQWFAQGIQANVQPPPAWKMNMLVLLQLYPVVFLFGWLIQEPLLSRRLGLPFWLALFIGNVVSVLVLNWLVPWTCRRFGWWLQTASPQRALDWRGASLVLGLYALSLLAFSRLA